MKPTWIRVTFLCLLAGALSLTSNAQSSLFVGGGGGLNLSKFKFDGDLSEEMPSSLLGLNGGITFGVKLNRLALVSGLVYNQKGSNYETTTEYYSSDLNNDGYEDYGYYSLKERLNYLTVPLKLRFQALGQESGLTLDAGVNLNFGLNANIEGSFQILDFNANSREIVNEYDLKRIGNAAWLDYGFGDGLDDEYRSFEASFVLSPGFFTPIGQSGRLQFNVLFDFGLSDSLNDRYKDAIGLQATQKNFSTGFMLTYEHHFEFQAGIVY